MKSRWYLWTFIMMAGIVVILLGSSMLGNTGMTSLMEQYPEIAEGKNFRGGIIREGVQEEIPLLLTDDQFRQGLTAVKLREMDAFDAMPSPRLQISFAGKTGDYILIAGQDGSLMVASAADPEGSRRFFLDRTGNIFRGLYEEHLLSGGGEIPEK